MRMRNYLPAFALFFAVDAGAQDWPQWRGPRARRRRGERVRGARHLAGSTDPGLDGRRGHRLRHPAPGGRESLAVRPVGRGGGPLLHRSGNGRDPLAFCVRGSVRHEPRDPASRSRTEVHPRPRLRAAVRPRDDRIGDRVRCGHRRAALARPGHRGRTALPHEHLTARSRRPRHRPRRGARRRGADGVRCGDRRRPLVLGRRRPVVRLPDAVRVRRSRAGGHLHPGTTSSGFPSPTAPCSGAGPFHHPVRYDLPDARPLPGPGDRKRQGERGDGLPRLPGPATAGAPSTSGGRGITPSTWRTRWSGTG